MRNLITSNLFSKVRFALLFVIAAAIAGCGGGGGGGGSTTGCLPFQAGCETTSPDATTATPKIVLALTSKSTGNSSVSLTSGKPLAVTATVTSATGVLLSDKLVTFVSSTPTLAVLDPASGTRLTGSDGKAAITLLAANVAAEGAGEVSASVDVDGKVVTTKIAYSVTAGTLTLQRLSANNASLSAYGSTSISVEVLLNGVLSTETQTVSFISSCASALPAKASIAASVATINGVATATYTDQGCSGDDTITASIQGTSLQARITVAAPKASNLSFISASPVSIVLAGTGGTDLSSDSVVTFKVRDSTNAAMASKGVTFDLSTRVGGIKLNNEAIGTVQGTTDASGLVSVTVSAGSIPTPVWVIATLNEDQTIRSLSPNLTISTGRPTQDRFSLAVEKFNVEGWNRDGETSALTVHAYDRLGNPVVDGTVVNFISEGGGVQPFCFTSDGACSVDFTSANPRPANGRVTILAYAQGEESFSDQGTNNTYDNGEPFRDLGDAYRDDNENGSWDLGEREIAFVGVTPDPNKICDGASKAGTCDGKWGRAHVRQSAVITLSSGRVGTVMPSTFPSQGCSGSFTFRLADVNGNPLPVATTITAIADTLVWTQPTPAPASPTTPFLYTRPVVPSSVPNTSALGGTTHTLDINAGSCTAFAKGTITLQFTTPNNESSTQKITIE